MCGIVGMAGDLGHNHKHLLKDMLDVSQMRGRHSTGVVKVDRNSENYTWVKRVGPPAYLFDSRSYEDTVNNGLAAAYIGHTRHKTVGDIDIKSAHPFDFEDQGICGVHNGTLKSYYDLDGYNYKKVDSEVLYEHLSQNGPEDTFPLITGAWCCNWWDNEAETINFIRNKERPLWFTWSKDLRVLYWASEIWMFSVVERKTDLWNGVNKDGEGKYIELPEDTLWSFSINANAKKDERVITMKAVKQIEGRKEEPKNYQSYYSQSRGSNNSGNGGGGKPSSASSGDSSNTKKGNVIEITSNGNSQSKGGEVKSPFVLTPEMEELNDKLPAYLLPPPADQRLPGLGGADAKTHTVSTVGRSITPSNTGADQSTPSKHGVSSSKKTTSEDQKSSNSNQRTNRKKLSAVSSTQPEKAWPSTSTRRGKGIDLRTVAGQLYITDNVTGTEYSEEQFDKNTKSICCHCKEPIGGLLEVAEIFSKEKFICTSCISTPTKQRKVA